MLNVVAVVLVVAILPALAFHREREPQRAIPLFYRALDLLVQLEMPRRAPIMVELRTKIADMFYIWALRDWEDEDYPCVFACLRDALLFDPRHSHAGPWLASLNEHLRRQRLERAQAARHVPQPKPRPPRAQARTGAPSP